MIFLFCPLLIFIPWRRYMPFCAFTKRNYVSESSFLLAAAFPRSCLHSWDEMASFENNLTTYLHRRVCNWELTHCLETTWATGHISEKKKKRKSHPIPPTVIFFFCQCRCFSITHKMYFVTLCSVLRLLMPLYDNSI